MPDREFTIQRASSDDSATRTRPAMLAISGDSASGKTTLTKGLVQALGADRITSMCVDDYHRYDRKERKSVPFTPLNPKCNYVAIMEQHLQLVAMGQSILKPVYNHSGGTLDRPVLVEPSEYVIIEGLLPLYTKLARACFDVRVHLDPPEELRHRWKIARDTSKRGYTEEEVLADLARREPESAEFIRPQRAHADIVVRFANIEERGESSDDPPSATILLRPTIAHPNLSEVITDDTRKALHLKLIRDEDGKPVDALHIHGYAPSELSRQLEQAIWASLGGDQPVPESLGVIEPGVRSEPLALTQLILLYHLIQARR
ncbi:MAG: phosphoribulokinase [Acidimicrobiales bacterium]